MDVKTKFGIAKKAMIVTTIEYLNKIAIANQEEALSLDEISEVAARADEMIVDEAIATADNPTLTSKILESVNKAAEEIQAGLEKKPLRIRPEDQGVIPIGSGSVLKEILTNPNTNTGGIELAPAVNISQANLLNGGVKKQLENKLSSLDWKNIVNIAKNASSDQELLNILNGDINMNRKQLEQVSIKLASLAGELLKIATDSNVETGAGTASAILANATSSNMQNNTANGVVGEVSATTDVPQATIQKAIEDPNLLKDKTPEQMVAQEGIKDNPVKKGAGLTDLRSIIAKHKTRK